MFEYFLSFMLVAPSPVLETWSGAVPPVNQARATRVRTEISGRPGDDCSPPAISLPPQNGGRLRFEERGVRYEGTEATTGNLVVRSAGPRPVTLTGNRTNGGLWSVGNDGRCVGVWRPQG